MKADANLDFCNLYLSWIKQNIDQFKVSDNTFRLTMPFLDRNNDQIEIYITKSNGSYLITDDGATLNDLFLSGFEISKNSKRENILNSIVAAHGVRRTADNELEVECTVDDLPMKKHLLAQCMLKVSDMFYLTRNNVQSLFLDDVQRFLDMHDVRYVPNISITGKSKLTTHYDFVIARSKSSHERLIKVVNNMDRNAAKSIIFSWNDIRETRPNAQAFAFIQNVDKKVPEDAIGALTEYDIRPLLWSEKESYIEELTA